MTNPYGYPAQPGYGYPAPERRPNGATAIIAGILGLALSGVLGYFPIKVFIELPSGFGLGDLRGEALTLLGLYFGAAIFLLIGSLVTFFRSVVGAILLLIGSLLAISAVVLEPVLFDYPFGGFVESVFKFGIEDMFVRAAGLTVGPITLILAALPPTFKYLRYRVADLPYGYPAYPPPQGYPQRQQGYPPRGR